MTTLADLTLFERLLLAKDQLEPVQSEYRIVYEDPNEPDGTAASILCPDPNWMACALHGGILPPVWVYWELAKDESQPGFTSHTRGYLLHETVPVDAMTEEEAIEYLVLKDIPRAVWDDKTANRQRFKICKIEDLPTTREFRNAWKLSQ